MVCLFISKVDIKYCKLYHIIFYRMLYRYASTSDFVFIEF